MLNFSCKPDATFTEIVNRALDEATDSINMGIELHDDEEDILSFMSADDIRIFGDHKGVLHELKRLKEALNSPDLYMPSDCHFLLLDRILNWWCSIYSDMAPEVCNDEGDKDGYVIKVNGKPLLDVDAGMLIDIFFWDTDYDFDPKVAAKMKQTGMDKNFGICSSGITASLKTAADSSDLQLVKVNIPESWKEDENEPLDWLHEHENEEE